jgi:hypothetical protein
MLRQFVAGWGFIFLGDRVFGKRYCNVDSPHSDKWSGIAVDLATGCPIKCARATSGICLQRQKRVNV